MAELNEDQAIAVTEIMGVTRDRLAKQCLILGPRLTAAVLARIDIHIADWDERGLGRKHTKIHPNTANFGAEIDPEKERKSIRDAIGNLLELDSWGPAASFEVELERG